MEKPRTIEQQLLSILFILSILIGTSSCNGTKPAPGNTKDTAVQANKEKLNPNNQEDAQFLVNMAETSTEGIELGRLAQGHSKRKNIIALGKMMEDGHRKMLAEVATLATQKGISVPTTQTDSTKDAYVKLNHMSGIDFDKEYTSMMVLGHRDVIAACEKIINNSNDIEIRKWTRNTLVNLKAHLEAAIKCQNSLGKL